MAHSEAMKNTSVQQTFSMEPSHAPAAHYQARRQGVQCNGEDDTATIQAALDAQLGLAGQFNGSAFPSVSGTVELPQGFCVRCSLRPESSQEHLPTSIAGVLRLRAIKPSICDRSAKRFAQDDGFVGALKYSWLDMQKTRKDRKSHRLSGWRVAPNLRRYCESHHLWTVGSQNTATATQFVVPSVALSTSATGDGIISCVLTHN
jgi:hypothetical protein